MTVALNAGPSTLTMIPTYRCTAACEQCCFGSNPTLRDRLSLDEILDAIRQAKSSFTTLKQVVFSGGECVMLGADLFAGLAYANNLHLQTRIVTNGYWGASGNKAKKVAQQLSESGLNEINFSTGRDHAKYVPVNAVITAAMASVEQGIFCLITVEQDADDSNIVKQLHADPRFQQLRELGESKFRFQINSWMAFNGAHKERKASPVKAPSNTPCSQLFSNLVVTPHKNISACCGLTFEHIPEMRIGTLHTNGLAAAYKDSANDFMKIWIHTDGPDGVVRKIYNDNPPPGLISDDHMCDTCARMHKCETTRNLIRERYHEFLPEVMTKYTLKRIVDEQLMRKTQPDVKEIA